MKATAGKRKGNKKIPRGKQKGLSTIRSGQVDSGRDAAELNKAFYSPRPEAGFDAEKLHVVPKSKFEEAPREVVKLRSQQRCTGHGSLATRNSGTSTGEHRQAEGQKTRDREDFEHPRVKLYACSLRTRYRYYSYIFSNTYKYYIYL